MNKRYYYAATALLGALCLTPARAEAPFSFKATPGQLSKNTIPSAYALNVNLDPDSLVLKGHEVITVAVVAPTRSVTLNQAGLHVTRAAIDDNAVQAIVHDEKKQTVTLFMRRALKAGQHRITLDYDGAILTTPNGLYSNDYRGEDGRTHRMLVTQFEVADARRMFPVWDEPAFKATFRLKVTLPADYVGVSNMPVEKTRRVGAGWKTLTFQKTPKMSSYLLAFIAGDMGSLQARSGATDIGVYTPKGKQEQGRYALQAAQSLLPYYNSYFGTSYPLPKMDMIAVPGNYQAGAMENWGALTYIDNDLLFDPKSSTLSTKELIYEVVAHEMAHQWSGDLVTMGWWNDLWLNEGFASWMEVKATAAFNPEWDFWTRQHQTREATMARDALPSTHPIQQVIHNVAEAESVFDAISYGKGELVIRMLEGWLGEDTFRDGMRHYMQAHAYSNATSQDLWNGLSKASGQDVSRVAKSFTEQKGLPQLNVALRCVGGKASYTLTQRRFVVHDPKASASIWSIPVVVGGPNQAVQKLVVGTRPVTVMGASCQTPLAFNWGESGYYRVNYDAASLALLEDHAAALPAVERATLLGDRYALFEAGRAPLSQYFNGVIRLVGAQERNSTVVEEVLSRFTALNGYEQGQADQEAFQQRVRPVLQPQLARLGWDAQEGESVLDSLLRPQVIEALGLLNDPQTLKEATPRFTAWLADANALRPELVAPVTAVMMRHADQNTWDRVAQRIQHADSTEVKLRLFNALSYVSDPSLIEQTVQFAYSGAIPNGRINRVLVMMARHSAHPEQVWQSVLAHKDEIRVHLTPGSQDTFIADIASCLLGVPTREALEADVKARPTHGAQLALKRALEQSAAQEDNRHRAVMQIHDWLHAP